MRLFLRMQNHSELLFSLLRGSGFFPLPFTAVSSYGSRWKLDRVLLFLDNFCNCSLYTSDSYQLTDLILLYLSGVYYSVFIVVHKSSKKTANILFCLFPRIILKFFYFGFTTII